MDKARLAVPHTVDQLLSFCRQAKAKGYIPMAFSDNPGWQAFHEFTMLSNNIVGPETMRRMLLQNKGSWNTPQITKAIKLFFVDMQKAGCFPPNVNALGYDDANSLFYTGKALMNPTGSWLADAIGQNVKGFQIAMMPFPAVSGGKGSFWDTGVGSAYYISAKSQHPQEAAEFLNYLIAQPAVKIWVEGADSFPPVKFDTSAVHVSPLFRYILNVLQSAISGKTQLGYNIDVLAPAPFNTAMQNDFQSILAGQKSPQQVASDLQTSWQKGMSGS
jgi:raffinose/stachyose/melibiose transport system substrate-binding protein